MYVSCVVVKSCCGCIGRVNSLLCFCGKDHKVNYCAPAQCDALEVISRTVAEAEAISAKFGVPMPIECAWCHKEVS